MTSEVLFQRVLRNFQSFGETLDTPRSEAEWLRMRGIGHKTLEALREKGLVVNPPEVLAARANKKQQELEEELEYLRERVAFNKARIARHLSYIKRWRQQLRSDMNRLHA